ncbi:alcohol dehydrogenase [Amylocarpus encephaloides]|uniref:Alcohol dehydrogenase n=1 Tax=Amylocarpus encephaloides TaxID=45428 RepID=A0A9P7Y908_9HELO|nr:alcohol dehydrogenase [Amylocarpus encephaloides]
MTVSSSIPSTIRCVLQPDFSSTDLIFTTLPIQLPKEGTDEHLIKVHAVAPCADELLWLRDYAHLMSPDRIGIPCYDVSGVVVTAPADSPFQPGTEVYARTPGKDTGNTREYTIAKTVHLAVKPKNLSWEEAAAAPISAFTAYQALFEHGDIKLGWKDEVGRLENSKKRILITAGSGGVGTWAVQLAKLAGVGEIIAVVGPSNVDFIKSLGATEVINYREQSLSFWATCNPEVDLVFDLLGGQTLAEAWTAVKDFGILLGVKEAPESRKPKEMESATLPKEVKNYWFLMRSDGSQLGEITKLIEAGLLRPFLDSIWEFEDAKKAFEKVESGHSRGKVVIKLL